MNKTNDFIGVFAALKQLMKPCAVGLDLITDSDKSYYLDTFHIMKNKKPLFFGAVQIKKNYVSYHLMPVYVNSSLLDSISPELRKRMQGKSCFNFKSIEPDTFQELAALTQNGYQFYIEESYIKADC